MRWLYNCLFDLFFLLSSPYYFARMRRRGNWQQGFGQRFGKYDAKLKQSVTNRQVIWIHAVSVGEVNMCVELLRQLEPRVPNYKLVVSTTTSTGMEELRKKLPADITKIYYPIDRRRCVARALSTFHPKAIILVEAEIWPNFLWRAHRSRIPVCIVNARLSDRSYRGYRRFGFLFRPIFRRMAAVGVQNEQDAQRLREVGVRADAIHVVGNLKFDTGKLENAPRIDAEELMRRIGVPGERPVLLGASTHAGEERVLGEIYLKLKREFPDLFLVLVPRHFERGRQVGEELEQLGVRYLYRSTVTERTRHERDDLDCLLVNTTGELRYFYPIATVVFVGKSLVAEGGQNPVEPGAAGRAMVFGPNMQNFPSISRALLDGEAAVQVQDRNELKAAIRDLLQEPEKREKLGRNALQVVRANQGSVERTVEMILAGGDL